MTMIKILEAPTQNERHKFVSFPNLNGSHQFNLDNYDIRIYYHKLFDNRTSKDKLYIDKYNSLDELEEDVYGNITHIDGGEWTTNSFKEVYNSLDKEKFLIKINQAIKKYGNMISVYGGVPFCIRTDEKIHLLSYLKGLHPDERIETWDMVYD